MNSYQRWSFSTFLPHEHLSQTFCIWRTNGENIVLFAEEYRGWNVSCQTSSHLTSEPLEPLLPPPPPQHQQPDEDYNDAHQHTGNCHHHLQTFTTTRIVLTHIGCLHQRCNGACAEVMVCVITGPVAQPWWTFRHHLHDREQLLVLLKENKTIWCESLNVSYWMSVTI